MPEDESITLSLPKSLGDDKDKVVELLKLLVIPELTNDPKFKQYLTKDLKTSNYKSEAEMQQASEYTDIAYQTALMIGKMDGFPLFMLMMRETNGAIAGSRDGFIAKIARSEIKIEDIKISDKKKQNILDRKGNQ